MSINYDAKKDGADKDKITIENNEYSVTITIKKTFEDVIDQNKNFMFGKDVMMMIKNLQRSPELKDLLMTHGSYELKDNKRDRLENCDIEY